MKGIIYYYHKELGEILFNNIVKDYEKIKIKVINKRKNDEMVFSNGDIWNLVKISENARGRSCNIAYIPSNVSDKDFEILKYTIKSNPYQGIHFYQGV